MKQIKLGTWMLLAGALLGGVLISSAAWAYEDEAVHQRVLELRKLKEENPEEFARIVGERKARIHSRLMEMKAKDPEKFEEMKRQFKHRRFEHMKRLREEDPEQFQQLMDQRRSQLLELRQTDPQRYEQVIRNHPRLAAFVENGTRPQGRARVRRFRRFD